MAAKCVYCETTENIIYSGVDALMYGCTHLTERICHNCASHYSTSLELDKLVEEGR